MNRGKNLKKRCGLCLAVFLFVSTAFPFTASAKTSNYYGAYYVVQQATYVKDGTTYTDTQEATTGSWIKVNYLNKYLTSLRIYVYFDDEKTKGIANIDVDDVVNTYFQLGGSDLFNYMSCTVTYSLYFQETGSKVLNYEKKAVGSGQNFSSESWTSTVSTTSSNTLNFMQITLSGITVSSDSSVYDNFTNITVYADQTYMHVEDADTGLLKTIINWLSSILDSIKSIPNSFDGSISSLGSAIGNFFTSLGDSISGLFKDLWSSLKASFDDIGDWFSNLGNSLSSWFSELGNNLSSWFSNLTDSLKNFFSKQTEDIWNGSEEEETVAYNDSLLNVINSINDYADSLGDTIDTINDSASTMQTYIKKGTSVLDAFLGASTALSAVVMAAVVIILVRKVVGR